MRNRLKNLKDSHQILDLHLNITTRASTLIINQIRNIVTSIVKEVGLEKIHTVQQIIEKISTEKIKVQERIKNIGGMIRISTRRILREIKNIGLDLEGQIQIKEKELGPRKIEI